MKKIIRTLALAAVAAVAITACNKEIEITPPDDGQEFVYTFAIGEDTAMTKAVLASDAIGKFAEWEDGDRLGSITTKTAGFSNITPAEGDNPATFSIYSKGGLTAGNTITVWYPYGGSTQNDATAVTLSIPEEQNHLSDGRFDFDAMPMVAKQITVTPEMASTNNQTPLATINLSNLGSVLNFKVFSTNDSYASEKVISVTFNAKNAAGTEDANIGGTFSKNLATIDPDNKETMTISSFTAGVSSIVTKPYADASIGADKAHALDLYMVVAPGTFSGSIVVKTNAAEYTYPLTARTFARSGIKAFGLDLNSANANRVENAIVDYVTLPWSAAGKTSSELTAIVGVTASGLGSDYASGNSPYLIKLDGTGDYIQIKTDAAIGTVEVDVKMIGGNSTSKITIKESANGLDWTEVQTFNISGAQDDVVLFSSTAAFSSTSRYVQLNFTKGSNVGLGRIAISKQVTDPIIVADNISVPATGAASGIAPYEARYFTTDDVEVAEVTGCVTAATASNGQITYDVNPNYTTSAVVGTIKLWSAGDHNVTKTINVTQEASVFEVSSTDDMAFKWNDETNNEEKTITITSTFALTESENVEVTGTGADKFTVSLTPKTGSSTEYNLGVWVNQDNQSETVYQAVVKVKRNDMEYSINLSQAHKGEVTDVLNRSLTNQTGTNYGSWSGKQSMSDAVYAGNSAGGNSSIQLRKSTGTQDPSGIVSTTSGGYAKKVSVSWESHTADGRTLNVYGKNTDYQATSELYDEDYAGYLIGTIVKGTTTTLDIPYDFQYIGLRSDDGAMYLAEIQIIWSDTQSGQNPPAPTYAVTWNAPTGAAATAGCLVSATVGGNVISSGDKFEEGTEVTITATAGTNYTFGGWTVTGATATNASSATTTFTVGKKDINFSASFSSNQGGSLTVNFENAADSYSDWTFTNMTSQQTSNITAHGGTYYGTTGGTATASMVTKEKIASPKSLSCFVSKQSTNTTSSTWKIQVSSNGTDWTDAGSHSATSMSKGEWVEFTANLSSYSNVYVRIYYSGSTAVRNIDDVSLTY